MPTSTIRSTYNVGGIALSSEVTRTQESQIGQTHTLTAGTDGTQTGWTDVDTCVVTTLDDPHTILTATVVDVYWYESGVLKVRYGVDATVALLVISLDGGDGDDFPDGVVAELEMIVTTQQDIDIDFDADLVELMAASCDKLAHIEWKTIVPASITGTKLLAGEAWEYLLNGEYANALTGETIASASVSTGDPDNDGTLRIGVLHSSA